MGLAWVYPGGMRYRAPYGANDNGNSGNNSNTGDRRNNKNSTIQKCS